MSAAAQVSDRSTDTENALAIVPVQHQEPACYPVPTAEYDDVVQDPDMFWESLQGFHSSFGTKFLVPTIGGNTLDLHKLFVLVTSHGGLEKVIRDRRWKEVVKDFQLSTSTSASFVLRKYYLSLLYHYEQVYYFHKEGPSISNSAAARSHLQPDCSLSGTIDGKFESGYLVSVNLGSDTLKGVLYHIPPALQISETSSSSATPPSRNRKRSRLSLRDPSRPKQNRSGYNFFFSENYTKLRPLYYGQEKAISKKIAHLWNGLSDAEKQVYQEKGIRDKERYETEMLEYRSTQ